MTTTHFDWTRSTGRFTVATVAAAVALFVPATIGLFSTRVPTVIAPFPAITAVPALMLSSRVLGVCIAPVLFLAWNYRLLRGQVGTPKRSFVLLTAAIILNLLWFAFGWRLGLLYQDRSYVHWVGLANVACAAGLGIAFLRHRRGQASFTRNLVLQWFLFAWLVWCAFPYLGELP